MNLLNSKTVRIFINFTVFIFCSFAHVQVKAWEVDFSRRQKELQSVRLPANIVDVPGASEQPKPSVFEVQGPKQEVVILHTDSGFVPNTISLKKDGNYQIHVVNVSSKKKNASFILDAFSEHHATYYGEQKTFNMTPKVEGVYSFVCPESSQQGQIIVLPDAHRSTASAE